MKRIPIRVFAVVFVILLFLGGTIGHGAANSKDEPIGTYEVVPVQHNSMTPSFTDYIQGDLIREMCLGIVIDEAARVGLPPVGPYEVYEVGAVELSDVAWESDFVHPVRGEWRLSFIAGTSSLQRRFNLHCTAVRGSEPHYTMLLMGNTFADPLLQYDVAKMVFTAAYVYAERLGIDVNSKFDCEIVHTEILEFEGPGQPWKERWYVWFPVGHMIPVPIRLIPNESGGTQIVVGP